MAGNHPRASKYPIFAEFVAQKVQILSIDIDVDLDKDEVAACV